jgi:hypothetical protein
VYGRSCPLSYHLEFAFLDTKERVSPCQGEMVTIK